MNNTTAAENIKHYQKRCLKFGKGIPCGSSLSVYKIFQGVTPTELHENFLKVYHRESRAELTGRNASWCETLFSSLIMQETRILLSKTPCKHLTLQGDSHSSVVSGKGS